jgi:phenylacetic acid degradation protein paaN
MFLIDNILILSLVDLVSMSILFVKHQSKLNSALEACAKRYAWSAYSESPSSKVHGADVPVNGKANFEAMLNKEFSLDMPGEIGRTGCEVSPYLQTRLGISYPKLDLDLLLPAVSSAMLKWADAPRDVRMGICLEILHQCSEQLFENAYATMHTAGQSFIMAFAGSGANALDRGLEALAYAQKAIQDVPETAIWERKFGEGALIKLQKTFTLRPRGVSVVICCATFPLWNAYPALMASLVTGNPVILKPHPNAILPVALLVRVCRGILQEQGFDPNLVTMVADTPQEPATIPLLTRDEVAIVDFTGSPQFGAWIEDNCNKASVYTETAGCNSVVIESTHDLHAMASAIAHSLCQASAQMCTSVQNIHIPAQGILVNQQQVSFDAVANAIKAAVDEQLSDPKKAAFLCGALVNDKVQSTIDHYRELGASRAKILRDSSPYQHPEFSNARTATPLILQVSNHDHDLYQKELFGPISFIIKGNNADTCLSSAAEDSAQFGAITAHVYSKSQQYIDKATTAFIDAGASVAFNLVGMPINFAAAYSDFHVTGLNPSGNACLTDLSFVANRFRIVQQKRMFN